MSNLQRLEKSIIIILISTLVAGLAVSALKKSRPPVNIKIGSFDAESALSNKSKTNINTADADELTRLKGVGKVLAGAIVEYRSRNGSFISIDDIKKVKGIGPALFEKLKDNVSVE